MCEMANDSRPSSRGRIRNVTSEGSDPALSDEGANPDWVDVEKLDEHARFLIGDDPTL